MRPMDTSEDAWRHMQEIMRKMSPAERFRRAVKLSCLAHKFAFAELKRQFPQENERQLRLRLLARTVDAATMKAAFGWSENDAQPREPDVASSAAR